MVTTIMIAAYIWNLYSNKHYWLHILVKFWASIANIKRMRVLKKSDALKIKANLNILAWISQLEVCIVCMSVMPEICTHTKIKPWEMFLALHGLNLWDEKDGYFGGRGNLESTMLLWLPIFR